jgi:vancomycin resistance protein VanJ
MRRAVSCFRALLAIALGGGILLRFTVRDAYEAVAIWFYATPWPVLAGLALLGAALSRRSWRVVATYFLVAFGCGGMWWRMSYFALGRSDVPHDLRVVSWNAEHAKSRLPDAVETARGFQADVLCITETESTTPADARRWAEAFPGSTVRTLPGFMLFITRGVIESTESGSLAQRGIYHVLALRLDGAAVRVVFVDFHANPLRSRAPAMAALEAVLARGSDLPTVVLGDFNLPRESVHFEWLRAGYVHAFEAAGSGFAETWPVPVPVLSLDHIWTNRQVRTLRCSHGWALSDHRPLVADLKFEAVER